MAVFLSNSGGAWDNAKKMVELAIDTMPSHWSECTKGIGLTQYPKLLSEGAQSPKEE